MDHVPFESSIMAEERSGIAVGLNRGHVSPPLTLFGGGGDPSSHLPTDCIHGRGVENQSTGFEVSSVSIQGSTLQTDCFRTRGRQRGLWVRVTVRRWLPPCLVEMCRAPVVTTNIGLTDRRLVSPRMSAESSNYFVTARISVLESLPRSEFVINSHHSS